MPVRLILTHENADFDAIASMLAMHKIDPAAIPVLPRRVNRNVRNFLTLYRSLLPAHDPENLQRQRVEMVIAVDTQSFNSVKGVRPQTRIHYVDHHPLSHELEPYESFEGEEVGANTTLMVERLQGEGLKVTGPEATFLLMGIYEDTGSLTFGSTTVRDLQAATWLLERGAQLDKVREFLSYPIHDEQRPIYDQLIENIDMRDIAGHSVLIATARTDEDVPEIANLSPKLLDLYDPNAMVIAVQMGNHVQLIGRSSVDEIDIGRFARCFDGGGHARASAAVIRHTRLDDLLPQIYEQLERVVQPSVRVRDIMSTGRIFSFEGDTTIGEAVERTRHISHEGYPVVREGQVVGLLTRHALDRAYNHGMLQQPVADIMEAGTVTVHSGDSLELLRQQMMESGWGQMPVVDASGSLVGIVTRTDLIRLWNETTIMPQRGGMILTKLQQSLPDNLWRLVAFITETAQTQDVGLYLVGGLVRDLLLDMPNLDIDFVVEGNAIDFVKEIQKSGGGEVHLHAQFNTAKWILTDGVANVIGFESQPAEWPEMIDFATARTEFYDEPTILPTVSQSSIKLDLHRRDFTINALAIRLSPQPAGELLDYYNGERDLRDGIIRVLHSLSFVDDPTRMIRAVRFEQRFDFDIEPRTAELFEKSLPLLTRLSGDRLRNELNLIMAERKPLANLERLDELGILRQLHPELKVDSWFRSACAALLYFRRHPVWKLPGDFNGWRVGMFGLMTIRLSDESLTMLAETLSIGRSNLKHLQNVQQAYRELRKLDADTLPSEIALWLNGMDHIDWVTLWAASSLRIQRERIISYVTEWQYVKPTYDGHRLMAEKGLSSGPAIGIILRKLHKAWLDGDITTPHEENILVEQLVDELETEQ